MIEKLWKTINVKTVQHILLFTVISGVGFFVGLLHLTESKIISDNSSHFKQPDLLANIFIITMIIIITKIK